MNTVRERQKKMHRCRNEHMPDAHYYHNFHAIQTGIDCIVVSIYKGNHYSFIVFLMAVEHMT